MTIFEYFLLTVLIVSLVVISGLAVWRLAKQDGTETKCPSCSQLSAVESLGEELVGIFRKSELPHFRGKGRETAARMVWHEKYKTHYRCKFCGHQWAITYSRKQ